MAATSDAKPWKPYQEFPLFAHQNGQWAKKIQGKLWFLGVWAHLDADFRKYLDEVAEIQAGRDPRRSGLVQVSLDQLTVYDFCKAFPERKLAGAKAAEVSNRHFQRVAQGQKLGCHAKARRREELVSHGCSLRGFATSRELSFSK